MNPHYPTLDEPATPEYVLAVLRDAHRQQCQYDPEAEPDVELTFETTVAAWRGACDLVGTGELGRAENTLWNIRLDEEAWRAVLEPARRRTLGDVCRLIAWHASRPRIRPARLLGSECQTADAFLTVRSLLREAGADAGAIAPSTRLDPYTRQHPCVFLGPISRLSPGALPLVEVDDPRPHGRAVGAFLLGWMVLAVGLCSGMPVFAIAGGVATFVSLAVAHRPAREDHPERVDFGDLRTFGDLARALVGDDGRNPRTITKGI